MKKFLIGVLLFILICIASVVTVVLKIQPTASDEEIREMIKQSRIENAKEFVLVEKGNVCTHTEVDTYTLTIPNCTNSGTNIKICKACGFKQEEITNKASHSFTSKIVQPSCSANGFSYNLCTVCGLECNSKILEKISHELQDVVISKSSCTTNGVIKTICKNCKTEFETKYASKTEHNWEENKTQLPTPIEKGFVEYKCSLCGLLNREQKTFQKIGENNLYIPSLSFNKEVILADCNQTNTDKYDICCDIGVIDNKNPLFFGHSTRSFSKLDQIEVGDLIYFTIGDKTTTYKVIVSEPAIVVDNGYNIKGIKTGEMCLSKKEQETLHFFTCYNVPLSSANRWIVIAEKI